MAQTSAPPPGCPPYGGYVKQVKGKSAILNIVETAVRMLKRCRSGCFSGMGASSRQGKLGATQGSGARSARRKVLPTASSLGASVVPGSHEDEDERGVEMASSGTILPTEPGSAIIDAHVGAKRQGAAASSQGTSSPDGTLKRDTPPIFSRSIPNPCRYTPSATSLRECATETSTGHPPEIRATTSLYLDEGTHNHDNLQGNWRDQPRPLSSPPTNILASGIDISDPGEERTYGAGVGMEQAKPSGGRVGRDGDMRLSTKTIGARVGDALSRLPLAKIKIVIGEWNFL